MSSEPQALSEPIHPLPGPKTLPTPMPSRAAIDATTPEQRERIVRHRRSGQLYQELHRGSLHADGTVMVVYRDENGRVWIRPAKQFDDGRYAPASDRLALPAACPEPGGETKADSS